MKLMVAMVLTTVAVVSALMEPAAAQRARVGNGYSVTGTDEQNVDTQLRLFDTPDSNSSPLIGDFLGSVDLERGNGEVCVGQAAICTTGTQQGRYFFNESGFPIFFRNFLPTRSQSNLNFRAELLTVADDPLQVRDYPSGVSRVIAYSIFQPGQTQPLFSARLTDFAAFDVNQAVNSLNYILDNNVLGRARPVIQVSDGVNILSIGDILINNRTVEQVPEPSLTVGALAAVSAGLLLKRKMKQNVTD